MKKLDIFDDNEFQSLDLEKKQSITTKYFDTEIADDDFNLLADDKKTSIRDNFINAQLDFDVSDSINKTTDAVKDFFSGEPKDKIVPNPNQAPTIQEQKPTYPFETSFTDPSIDLTAPDKVLDVQYKKEFDDSNIIDQVQSSLLQQSKESARALSKFSKRGLESIGADELANKVPEIKPMTQEEADFIVGYSKANRVTDKKDMLDIKKSWGNGDYLTATAKAIKELPSVLADSSGEIAQLLNTPTTLLAITTRVSKYEDDYVKNNDGKMPDASWYAEAIATQSVLLLAEKVGIKVLGKTLKSTKPKTALGVGIGIGEGFAFEGTQEYGDTVSQEYLTQKDGAKTLGEIATSDDAKFSAFIGGVTGGGMKGGAELGSVVFNKITPEKKNTLRDEYIQDAYNKEILGSGLVTSIDDNGYVVFKNKLDEKVKKIQDNFENLVINNPDIDIPVEAVDNIDVQEAVVNNAKNQGLDVSNSDGLNAIDKGFKELEAEIGGVNEIALEPKGVDVETTKVAEPDVVQVEAEPISVEERRKQLKKNQDILSVEGTIAEFDNIQAQEAKEKGITVQELNKQGWAKTNKLREEIQAKDKNIDIINATNLYEDDNPELQAENIKSYENGKNFIYTDSSGHTQNITVAPVDTQKKHGNKFVGVVNKAGSEFGVMVSSLSLVEKETFKQGGLVDEQLRSYSDEVLDYKYNNSSNKKTKNTFKREIDRRAQENNIERNKDIETALDGTNYKIYDDGSVLEIKKDGKLTDFRLNKEKEDMVRKSASWSGATPEYEFSNLSKVYQVSKLSKSSYYASEQKYKNFIDKLETGDLPKNEATTIALNEMATALEVKAKQLNQTREMYKNESELRKYEGLDKDTVKKYEDGTNRRKDSTASRRSDANIQETTQSNERQTRGTRDNNARDNRQTRKDIVFDSAKVYSTKGVMHETPNVLISKQIQKDVARYVKQLADRLGYEFALNTKGKKLTYNGVSDNIAPSGGNATFKLFKPGSDIGIYVSLNYDLDFESDPNNDGYTLSDGFVGGHLFRTTSKSGSDGTNQFIPTHKLTSNEFIDDISYEVENRIKREDKDNGSKNQSSATTDRASDPTGVPTSKQETSKQSTDKGSDKPVPNSDKRPNGLSNDRSNSNEVSTKDDRVDRLQTPTKDKLNEQQTANADTVLPKPDERLSPSKNYSLVGKDLVELTKGQRKKFNAAALEIIKKPLEDITDADREILRQYTGEGGLDAVNKNSINQHYTNYETVEAMYSALKSAGITMDKILEPAVGSGNFVGFNPDAEWDVVDIDTTNIEVTKRLYPQIKNFYADTYETFAGKNYDLIISNVPFASEQLLMREHSMTIKPAFKAIHNFYFAHSIDKVKDNGVVAFMTSTGTMNGTTTARSLRKYLMDRGDLIGAFRLPEKSQAKNAHTDTMIDIIFIQKRPTGVGSRQAAINNQFINVGSKDGLAMNEYFIANPENLLGDEVVKDKDKTKMGKEGWIVRGESKLENIKLSYEPYKKLKKSKEDKSSFIDLDEARVYAKNNALAMRIVQDTKPFSEITSDSFTLFDKKISFRDSEQIVMFGEKLKGNNTNKALHLNRIMTLTEDAVSQESKSLLKNALSEIESYKEIYGKSPHNDLGLKKFMKQNRADVKLKEFMSYFDKEFNPAAIYGEKTRFKNSGDIKVDASSPLMDRALFYSNFDSVIDTSKANEFLNASEIQKLIDDELFVKSGENEIQLSFMYYAGNVYKKIDTLENLKANANISDKEYTKQLKKLKEIIPKAIAYKSIKVKGGESWIPSAVSDKLLRVKTGELEVNAIVFDGSLSQIELYNRYLNKTALAPKGKEESDAENIQKTMDAEKILNETLIPKVMQYIESVGLSEILTNEYNRFSNFYVRPEMTGVLLRDLPKSFRGKPFTMQSHQAEGAEKIVFNKKGVLAFAPGGGKTITAVVAVKNLLDQGVMKKPLFVVPVNTIAQWEETVKELYPDASVFEFPKVKSGKNKGNAKEWTQLSREDKEQMAFDLANNRYDFTIIGDTMFQKFGLPDDVMSEYVDDLVSQMIKEESATEGSSKKDKKEIVSAEQKRKALKVGLKQAYGGEVEFDFAKLGFDGLIADEVQYYKNIGMQGKDTKGGLGATVAMKYYNRQGDSLITKDIKDGAEPYSAMLGSMRSYDFRFKSKYVSQNNNGNNVILLTGTPTPNKPLELYTLLQHLDENILLEYGIEASSDFVDTFYDIENYETTDSTGKIVKREGLGSMKNLEWLGKILDRYVDYKGFESMPDLPRPKQIEVEHYMQLSKAGEVIFGDVQARLIQAIEDGKQVKSGAVPADSIEIALVPMGAGRSASIDLRLYDVGTKGKSGLTPDELAQLIVDDEATIENNKILKTVDLVKKQYKENSDSGQIIFLDRLKVKNPDGTTTSTHQEIREQVLATGLFDETEVVFVNGGEFVNPTAGKISKGSIKPDMLNKIIDMYNAGKIKVIIGNTSKLGVGVDLNKKTTDIYQLDIPFRPDEIEQRWNRGVRQGNENAFVRTHQFFQLGTFDKRSYDIVIAKRGFNDIYGFTDSSDVVSADGVSKIDNKSMTDPYQAIIDLESDPFVREKLRKQRIIDNAVVDANNLKNLVTKLEADIRVKQGSIVNYENGIKGIESNLQEKNYPEYKAIKDADEKQAKLEKYISDNKDRKVKYENTIKEINDEIKVLESKLDDRRDKQATQHADTKFITDEYTRDGKNVDVALIKKSYTEQQILESEESVSDSGFNSYMRHSVTKETEGLSTFFDKAIKIKNKLLTFRVEKISKAESEVINKKFSLKHPLNITRVVDNYQLSHIMKEHGDSVIEAKRGNIAVTKSDILHYVDIIKSADMSYFDGKTRSGKPALVYGKQVTDKYFIIVEEVRTGKSDLVLFNMYKHKGKLSEDDLKLQKDKVKSPSSASKTIKDDLSQSKSLSAIDRSITKKEQKNQDEADAYARSHGYDEAGANYVPTYSAIDMPTRSKNGTINIGIKTVLLPTMDSPMNADSLRVYLKDIIGNRLYEAKIKAKSALGIYKRKDSAIRVKNYSDMEVMAHEMAHYLDFFYKNKTKKANESFFRKEILRNKEEVKALSYTTDPKQVISEGFAEFVRLWLTNYNALELVAPNMVADFEVKLLSDKELHKKMTLLQEGMHQYFYQGSHATLRSKQGGELNKTAKKLERSQAERAKSFRQAAIDKIHSIKRIEAEILGDNAADAIDSPYKLLQLVNGASSIMYSAMNIGTPTVKENGDISYGGKSLNDIFTPVTSMGEERVRLFSDFLVAKRADELRTQGRENLITKDEIRVGLDLGEMHPEFEAVFDEYQKFNDGMLDFYVSMNLITSSQRENFQEFNKNYVPFHRVTESVQFGEVPPSTIGQRLTGGTRSLGDIMENIINGIESNIKEALIFRGKSVFYEMLEESGMGGVYATKVSTENKLVKSDINQQAKKIALIMSELGITVSRDGMILSGDITSDNIIDVKEIESNLILNPEALEFWTHGHKPTSKSGYIDSAIINDKVIYFEVNDKGLIDAMTSFRSAHYNELVQGLMTIKNVMTWNITNNPLFYLTNFVRDTISASVLSKNNFKPVLSSMAGAYHFVTKSKVFKEFMASGAGYGTRRTTLGSDIQAMSILKVNRGLDLVNRLVSGMEYGADIFEYGTRVGDFALAQKANKSNLQASYEAREVSTDFAIKGGNDTFSGFMATVPFMKAGINGIDKTARRIFSLNGEMKFSNAVKFKNQLGELQTHKIKIYAAGGIIAGLTLALWLQNRDDERYKKLTRDSKLMYWHFFVGDEHIKIPRPYDIGFAFSTIPEIIADGIFTKHGEQAVKDFLWGAKNMFSVGDISGLFQPILEDMTNTNWTGSPIVPRNMQNLDDLRDQYFSSTPKMYREFGKATGASPIKVQHYIDGYLGLTAKMIEEVTENILWNKKEWGARPFERNALEFLTYRFKAREVEPRSRYSEKYYELMKKASGVKASYEKKKKEAFIDKGKDIREYMSDKEKQAYTGVDKMLKKFNKTLTQIKVSIEVVSYDKSLSKLQKEKLINDAYTNKTAIFKEVTESLEVELKLLEGK